MTRRLSTMALRIIFFCSAMHMSFSLMHYLGSLIDPFTLNVLVTICILAFLVLGLTSPDPNYGEKRNNEFLNKADDILVYPMVQTGLYIMDCIFSPKKGCRLWNSFLPVFYYWFSIVFTMSIIWSAWIIFLIIGSYMEPSTLRTLKQVLLSIWVILLLSIVYFDNLDNDDDEEEEGGEEEEDYEDEDDEEDYTERIAELALALSPFTFTIATAVGGIRVMIFPIGIMCLVYCFNIFSQLMDAQFAKYNLDFSKVCSLMNAKRYKEHLYRCNFTLHVCNHCFIALAILFIVASVCPRMFDVCFLVGTFNITLVVLMHSLDMYKYAVISQPFRDVLGDSIPNDNISWGNFSIEKYRDLCSIYPEGFDMDRLHFLLHDTLREDKYCWDDDRWHFARHCTKREEKRVSVDTIQKFINIFPNCMKVVDDKGDTPFLLACRYSPVEVVEYLIGRDDTLLDTHNDKGDTAMHYACRGNNYEVVKYLLERYSGLVTKRNVKGDLPVYLLCCPLSSRSYLYDTCISRYDDAEQLRFDHSVITNVSIFEEHPCFEYGALRRSLTYKKKPSERPGWAERDAIWQLRLNEICVDDENRTELIWRLLLAYPDDINQYHNRVEKTKT